MPDPQASTAPVDAEPATRIRLAGPVRPEIRPYFVLGLISLAVSLYLTGHLLGDLPNRMVAANPADIRLFTWYLEQDSQAVLHGHDPLFLTAMNAPAGVNAMWNTSLLLPALIMTPVTLLAGPLASYNVLFVLALATGPLCAFALLRRFTDSVPAAGLGALVFGFSPAVLASGVGHINLVLTGLMPITLLLADDLATGRCGPWRGGAAVGLAMAAQLFTSEELLFQTGPGAAGSRVPGAGDAAPRRHGGGSGPDRPGHRGRARRVLVRIRRSPVAAVLGTVAPVREPVHAGVLRDGSPGVLCPLGHALADNEGQCGVRGLLRAWRPRVPGLPGHPASGGRSNRGHHPDR